MHAMELLALIFQDLSSKDLPPFMEDNMSQFMQIWHKYFTYSNPLLEADADEDQPGPMELVRTAICGIVELYTIKYGEDFPMVTQFIESIWKLLSDTGKDARFDGVCLHDDLGWDGLDEDIFFFPFFSFPSHFSDITLTSTFSWSESPWPSSPWSLGFGDIKNCSKIKE